MLRLRRSSLIFVIPALIVGIFLLSPVPARAEGSRTLFPNPNPAPACAPAGACRANTEWNPTAYYGNPGDIARRTIFRVFAQANEVILVGSSAVGVDAAPVTAPPAPPGYHLPETIGNVIILAPGVMPITGVNIGDEPLPDFDTLPDTQLVMSCVRQRFESGLATRGFIANRDQELAGPNNLTLATGVDLGGGGYAPCYYQVPAGATGIYTIIFFGPMGNNNSAGGNVPTGQIGNVAGNTNATQNATSAMWDVTVRGAAAGNTVAPDFNGRLFAFYLSLFTASNGRPVYSTFYPVTRDGYIYRTTMRGTDPNGFIVYGNRLGFLDTDGTTPLYRNIRGNGNQLTGFRSNTGVLNVQFARPDFPIFLNPPDPLALVALGIDDTPDAPTLNTVTFVGRGGAPGVTNLSQGGFFTYTSAVPGNYEIVISRDGIDFDPTTTTNKVLRGVSNTTTLTVEWDGTDNAGVPFPVGGPYAIRAFVRAGEYHFPLLDGENNLLGVPGGGPTIELLNPPNGTCPPWNGGCFGAFYDDRGYRTLDGSIVGTVNGDLCPLNPGNSNDNDPAVLYSGVVGYDTRTAQRAFGFGLNQGNSGADCAVGGAFGDSKGLDLWTYFPSNRGETTFIILPPGVGTATPTPTPTGTPTPGSSSGSPELGSTPAPGSVNAPVGNPVCLTEQGRTLPQCQGTVLANVQELPATGESPWSPWRSVLLALPVVLLFGACAVVWRRRTARA
ncbi:MAG: hypothetical protein SF029_05415 [bacterium]|nr:hypothetical protein [bacterium]